MAIPEYPIDEEFWKWWNSYWEKVDISENLCYNFNRKEDKEYVCDGTVEVHEYPPRLDAGTSG